MLPGRTEEYKYLETAIRRDSNQILILYGRNGVGKTSIIKDFCKDKSLSYFRAENVSGSTLLKLWSENLNSAEATYESIKQTLISKTNGKFVLCVDEFHNFIKNSDGFMSEIINLIHSEIKSGNILVVLMSSDTDFVENQMVGKIGANAYEISGFLKIRELSFLDMVRRFPKMSVPQCIETYSVLGGIPGLWRYFSQNLSLKDNICRTILKKGTVLYDQAENEIENALRESEVYNTILYELACGKDKLNDIYNATGYSRAKISVYLKNLMEIEMVQKLSSIDTPGRDNSRKGIYKICNHLVFFYFRFVFPHRSMLSVMAPEEFYDKYIEKELDDYTAKFFPNICSEYIDLLSQSNEIDIKIDENGCFYGKGGTIDIVAFDEDRKKCLCGIAKYSDSDFSYSEYEALLSYCNNAKVKPDLIYLFSSKKFDDKLLDLAESDNNISLVDLSML